MKNNTNRGFVQILVAIVAILVAGGASYFAIENSKENTKLREEIAFQQSEEQADLDFNINSSENLGLNTNTNTNNQTNTNLNTNTKSDCLPTTTPWIKVISPNGGETYTAGQNITVKWKTCNASNTRIFIEIYNPKTTALGLVNDIDHGIENDGTETIKLSDPNIIAGQYELRIYAGGLSSGVLRDSSDGTFTINKKTNTNTNYTTYNSDIYGYSINYNGVGANSVYVEGDGKKINLFPNQSNIDSLEVVDSSYAMPNYTYSVGTVTFGSNQYKKYKDNITTRHTYYFKSGLKNNKAILITIENNFDNPNYFDLASLSIKMEEIFNNQPGAIKKITTQGNNWLLEVDLLSINPNFIPGSSSFYLNQNQTIRNLIVTPNTKTYDCKGTAPILLVDTSTFMSNLQNIIIKEKAGLQFKIGGPIESITDWVTVNFDINGNSISAIYTACLP